MTVRFLVLLFISLSFVNHSICQTYDYDKDLNGNWKLGGLLFEGTYYPTNDWENENLSLSDNYTFLLQFQDYINKQNVGQEISGNWMLSKQESTIILFRENDRFVDDIAVKTLFKQYKILSLTPNFLALIDLSEHNRKILIFQKGNQSIAEYSSDLKRYIDEQAEKNKIFNTNIYTLINGNNKANKLYKNADYEMKFYSGNYPFEETQTRIIGKLNSISDTTLTFKNYRLSKVRQEKTTIFKDYYSIFLPKNKTEFSISPNRITQVLLPVSSIGKKASLYFSIASAATTIILAPIIGITSHYPNQMRNFLITAGTGIIGVGIGTGSYFLFDHFKYNFRSKKEKSINLRPIYDYK